MVVDELSGISLDHGPHVGKTISEALADPSFVQASRWRGGSRAKQVTAALAKTMKYLKGCAPGSFLVASPRRLQRLAAKAHMLVSGYVATSSILDSLVGVLWIHVALP